MTDTEDERYRIVSYQILGQRWWRVLDGHNPDEWVKRLRADVNQDEFNNQADAIDLCDRLNGES